MPVGATGTSSFIRGGMGASQDETGQQGAVEGLMACSVADYKILSVVVKILFWPT
jgi:hypothetical protein